MTPPPSNPVQSTQPMTATHTPTPWMTQPCGELLPDDVMIVADMGKLPNGIQQISTVARVLSIRQTPEAREFGVHRAVIARIRGGHSYKWVGVSDQPDVSEALRQGNKP